MSNRKRVAKILHQAGKALTAEEICSRDLAGKLTPEKVAVAVDGMPGRILHTKTRFELVA